MELNARGKIDKALGRLVLKRPFYGATALRLEIVEDNTQPTGYTDAKVIGYNRYFVDQLSLDEVEFLLCHEVLHVVLKHPWRREGREPGLFNEACDYVINLLCKDDNFSLIGNILCDEKYRGMSSEYIYSRLLKDRKKEKADDDSSSQSSSEDGSKSDADGGGGGGGGNGVGEGEYGPSDVPSFEDAVKSGQLGEIRDCVDEDDKSDTQCEAEWESAITVAVANEKRCGNMPGSVLSALNGRNESFIDWHEVLANFLSDAGNNFEVTWAKPNRRFVDDGWYFPSMKREGISDLVVAVDTSGSCSDDEIKQFCSETLDIADQFDCKITFIPCDTRIGKVQEFESGEYPDEVDGFRIGGRGGTNFDPPFEWVANNMDDAPTAMIYFTDGECSYPDEPEYPVLWAISTGPYFREAPWGQTVEVIV